MKKPFNLLLAALLGLGVAPQLPLQAQPRVIAHRGYWNTAGSAQNSLAALRGADSLRVFGSECDVWLCSDDALLVEHDHQVDLDGRKAPMEETASTALRRYMLSNGEMMPTFEAYLEAMALCRHTRLIIELKSTASLPPERQTLLVERALAAVQQAGLEGRVEYIAFSRFVCEEVVRLLPGAKVAYLNGDLTPEEVKAMGCTGLDYHEGVFKKHPGWIARAHALGLEVNVWTVNDPQAMRWFIARGVDYITTDEPVLLQQILTDSVSR